VAVARAPPGPPVLQNQLVTSPVHRTAPRQQHAPPPLRLPLRLLSTRAWRGVSGWGGVGGLWLSLEKQSFCMVLDRSWP